MLPNATRPLSIPTRAVSPEVIFSDRERTWLTKDDAGALVELARQSTRNRVRLCTHTTTADLIHEMLIVNTRKTYVRPHKNAKVSKSYTVISGEVDLVLFEENGAIQSAVRMGDYSTGRSFYFRMSRPGYHTLVPRSETLIFIETTNGPFQSSDTTYAAWAPAESDAIGQREYLRKLDDELSAYQPT